MIYNRIKRGRLFEAGYMKENKSSWIKALGAVAVFFMCCPLALAGPVDEIRERQRGISTVQAGFKQEKHTELLERPIKSEGAFYFKSPVGVRWHYDGAMEVVYDGKTLYLLYTELGEVEKVEGAGGFVGPLTFDMGELLKDYDVEAEKADGTIRLDLKPRKRMPFASMQMVFKEGTPFPEQVTVLEESGDRTVIRFHDIKTNTPLSDELFVFTPPPGVRVRERELGR
jgi:outer membrane lipoprotein-sorting protein